MTYTGHMHDGQLIFDGPAPPDGTTVRVELNPDPPAAEPPPSLLEQLKNFVGQAHGLPEDAASQVDHYLYGHPKR